MVTIPSDAHRALPGLPGRLSGAWRRVLRCWTRWRLTRRDVDALSALDDRQLLDIGLVRGQIGSTVAARHFPRSFS